MGIFGFTHLKCYARGLRYIRPHKSSLRFHALGIDLNQLLHASLYEKRVKTKQQLFQAISRRVLAVTDAFRETKHLGLFVDGPPPYAKLKLMRKRREKKQSQTLIFDTEKERLPLYSPVHLTPGSKLLDEIEHYLKNRFPKAYLKSHRENGEGELALTNWIRNICTRSDSALICGGDADLILLGAAALKDVGNVFIMPEMSSKASKNCPIINPFQILATYPNVSAADFTAASTLFLGNDYVNPLVRSISRFEQTLMFLSKNGGKHEQGLVQDDGTLSTGILGEICTHLNGINHNNCDGRILVSDEACESYLKAVAW
eukprot:CAMPEP_0204822780 /NCGR_PEP_ID=MMETSP1346-20131115/961_1 /ASSEMBLY_ACC=CAM_ASM_000771 /TAXON_ID=215587 /ORGANISM="Aplanochytrium stocchinoi, Strain GSBS06" /LENGTH=315 /DNA_ID=CAMNT_0051949167 /DNA_START=67 /DNA_END=1011 /DNA_ORIENTATION=+